MAKVIQEEEDWRSKSYPMAGEGVNRTGLPETRGRDIADGAIKSVIPNMTPMDEPDYVGASDQFSGASKMLGHLQKGANYLTSIEDIKRDFGRNDALDGKEEPAPIGVVTPENVGSAENIPNATPENAGELQNTGGIPNRKALDAINGNDLDDNLSALGISGGTDVGYGGIKQYAHEMEDGRVIPSFTNLNRGEFASALGDDNGEYAYANGDKSNIPLGGWNSLEDMSDDTQRRKVTGKLSNGSTYTYFLRPGETEPAVPGDRFAAAKTGNEDQDSLNSMGAFMAEGSAREKAERQRAIDINNGPQRKAYAEARTIETKNALAKYYMDNGDHDIARSLFSDVKEDSVIPPKWKPQTNKQYDDLGNVTSESTTFYQENGPNNPLASSQKTQTGDKYKEALAKVKKGLEGNPKLRQKAMEMLREEFGSMFSEADLED